MRHDARGKNKRRRVPFTDAQELAVWCSMLESYLGPYALLEQFAYAVLVTKNQVLARKYAKRIRATFQARNAPIEPKHTPEFKTMVVKAYARARRGNKATVLRQFGVTQQQLANWKLQVKYRRFKGDHIKVAKRLLASWTPPTPQVKVAAHRDFALRIAEERRQEQKSRMAKTIRERWTRLRELPSLAQQVTNDAALGDSGGDDGERLTPVRRFELIE